MAGFEGSFNGLMKSSLSFNEMDLMQQFADMSESVMQINPSIANGSYTLMSHDQQNDFSLPFTDNSSVLLPDESEKDKKRKAKTTPEIENKCKLVEKNRSGRGKRMRYNPKDDDQKPKEVVHVRAKRGQATDSHSLAERVRREKINERMRCLQDLVPGCYKAMGMAVMLDEIINYVQSLQNQVEFLSMKLSAASLDMEAMAAQVSCNAYEEAQEVERLVIEGYGGCTTSFPFTQH
ncbi:hypothetical protein J5N97_027837 [Dioscorea zingiberensis]|uniref:BHLH domain-containing protein n=1 Tax=Dioscorea zingiberensis TaxID=325984 RepID=A0A9D5H447_9LILI|nr:hypothetical protein J5N97_027837 [Dioscorea zingiberensis]